MHLFGVKKKKLLTLIFVENEFQDSSDEMELSNLETQLSDVCFGWVAESDCFLTSSF
jgi:hypothetical protein